MNTESDAQLWRKSRSGDREAFGQIVARYQTLICSLAYSRCGRLSWSEDLAQETFIAAWQRLSELRDPERLRAWLCGIVRHRASHATRRESRRGGPPASLDAASEISSVELDPAVAAVTSDDAAVLWRSLEQVPEIYREPLVLFYRQGHSVAEVAQALDLTQDAVKQRLSRGRALLRDELAGLVERTLVRTRPTAAFTAGVLSVVATLTPPVAEAAIIAGGAVGSGAVGGGGAAKGVFAGLGKAILIGPAIGLLVGWLGTRAAASTARSPKERACLLRHARRTIAFCWLMSLGLAAGMYSLGTFYTPSPVWIIVGVFVWTAALVGPILVSSARVDREILRLRQETGTDDATWGQGSARLGRLTRRTWQFESKARLLGIPLFAIECGPVDGPVSDTAVRGRVVGWIAVGDVAVSPLLALGGIAIAPMAVGAITVGFVSFSLWGLAFGGLAFGSLAVGWWAYGFGALGWTSAAGAAAVARDYAMGPFARAEQVNTPQAYDWFSSQWFTLPVNAFLHCAHWVIVLIIALAWGRMWLQARERRRVTG